MSIGKLPQDENGYYILKIPADIIKSVEDLSEKVTTKTDLDVTGWMYYIIYAGIDVIKWVHDL